jgi:hypothetical protein
MIAIRLSVFYPLKTTIRRAGIRVSTARAGGHHHPKTDEIATTVRMIAVTPRAIKTDIVSSADGNRING